MRRLIALSVIGLSIFVIPEKSFAQTNIAQVDKIKPDSVVKLTLNGKIIFGGGIGASMGFLSWPYYPVPKINYGDDLYYQYFGITNISPAYNGYLEYGISSVISMGVAVTYQQEDFTYNSNLTDLISRLNVAGRILFHLRKNVHHIDDYVGLRIGCSYWKDVFVEQPGLYPGTPAFNFPTLNRASFQVLYGLTGYLNKFIGVNFEAGIGTPYVVEIGLILRS